MEKSDETDSYLGLKKDGTVISTKINTKAYVLGQTEVADWKKIVSVAAGSHFTVGLRSNGKVKAAGQNYHGQCDIEGWKDIVEIVASGDTSFGVKADGTVVVVGYVRGYGETEVDGWTDIADPNS